jgi:hypothetical protein
MAEPLGMRKLARAFLKMPMAQDIGAIFKGGSKLEHPQGLKPQQSA